VTGNQHPEEISTAKIGGSAPLAVSTLHLAMSKHLAQLICHAMWEFPT